MELQRKDIGEEKMIDVSCFKEEDETIDSLIEWLQNVKKEGGMYLDISGSSDRDGDIEEVILQAYREYAETPKQARERIENEQAEEKEIDERELERAKQRYERLKKKVENN